MDPTNEDNSCAYVMVEVKIEDPAGYEEYKRLAPASIHSYGGRYLVRGGEATVLEGDWSPSRMVLLRFPSVARAQEWWNSPEYTEAKKVRASAATLDMIVLPGVL